MFPRLALSGALLAVVQAIAQSPSGDSSGNLIEAASIKPSNPASCGEYPIVDGHGDKLDLTCVKVRFLMQTAFNVRDFQISGGPGWLDSEQYDIHVKLTRSGEPLRSVLQSLLADRMQLKEHPGTEERPVYLLTIAKGGSKLKSSGGDPDVSGGLRSGNGLLAGSRTEVSFLTQVLSQIVGRPILDRTGLTGKYDFELRWTPDQSSANSPVGGLVPPSAPQDPEHPNIFTAIREQLGLTLTSGKGPANVIYVDHVERPSAN